jgi:hypothetical protein
MGPVTVRSARRLVHVPSGPSDDSPVWHPKARALSAAEQRIATTGLDLVVASGIYVDAIDDPGAAGLIGKAIVEHDLALPVLVRSCSSAEDIGGMFSGALESYVLLESVGLGAVLSTMADEARSVGAGRPGVLIQELVVVRTGAVVGCRVEHGRVVAVRVEAAEGRVPVDTAPQVVVSYEVLLPHVGLVPVSEVDISLAGLVATAVELVEVTVSDTGMSEAFAELELAVDVNDRPYLFQIRIDDIDGDLDLVPARPARNFGADRNYPLPVSHLTGSLVAPVFTATFGARVWMDDTRQLLTDAAILPTPYLRHLAGTVGAEPLDLARLRVLEAWHERWWADLVAWREELEVMALPDRVAAAFAGLRSTLDIYFRNPLWLACLHTAWTALPLTDELVSALSPLLRSFRSVEVLDALRTGRFDGVDSTSLVDVAFVGDDEVLTPTVLDDIASDPIMVTRLEHGLGTTVGDVAEAATVYRPVFSAAERTIDELSGSVSLTGGQINVVLAHTYQELDNAFKELAYLAVRDTLVAVDAASGVPVADLALLLADEVVAVASGTLPQVTAQGLAADRVSVEVTVTPPPLDPVEHIVIVKGTVAQLPVEGVVIDRHCHEDCTTGRRILWVPSLSALDARRLPPAEVVIVGQLGMLAHGANGLRAARGIELALAGWNPPEPPTPGTYLTISRTASRITIGAHP